jgi:glyoxalase family protein
MRLEGIHHVTAITAEAQRNLDFYVGTLGLRFVKKTVNYDQPDVYHLYYGDESGRPGSIMTFFEFPGAAQGSHGAGMVHTVTWRVAGPEALDFWERRLAHAGVEGHRTEGSLRFTDPEGLGIELLSVAIDEPPLVAAAEDIPAEHALQGFHGVRAYAAAPIDSQPLLEALAFDSPEGDDHDWIVAGIGRRATFGYDEPPDWPGIQGAGTVHHVAWASQDDDHERWREVARAAGAHVTPVIDRTYFRSVYFREPSGVLFEIATLSPGFAVDEPDGRLGESLVLPARHEHLRAALEQRLTPIADPRRGARL